MKPTFALDFRNDAITLLHRVPRGWQPIGHVALDAPDLDEALSYLRATALGLSPRGMVTKLIIPNSQILYTQVTVPDMVGSRKRKQVLRGLEGLTPYALSDLAFDMWGEGPEFQVAVVAKETLAEAEAFAVQHRFSPVSFVAIPENGLFLGEPWFGPTSCAAECLPEGEKLGRDLEPVAILSRDLPGEPSAAEPPADVAAESDPEPATAPILESDEDAPPLTEPDAAPIPDPVPEESGPDAPFIADPAPQPDEGPVAVADHSDWRQEPVFAQDAAAPDVAAEVSPLPPAPLPFADPDPVTPPETISAEPAWAAPVADPEFEQALTRSLADADTPTTPAMEPVTDAELAPSDPEPAPEQTLANPPFPAPERMEPVPDARTAPPETVAPDIMADEAPIALDVVDDLPDDPPPPFTVVPAPAAASVLDPTIHDDIPPPPATSIMMAFASRRAAEAAAAETAAKTGGKSGSAKSAGGRAPALGAVTATRTGGSAKVTTLPTRNAAPNLAAVPQRGAEPPTPAAASKAAIKGSASGKSLRRLGALVTDPAIPGIKERRPVVQTVTPPTGPTSAASAAAATLSKPGAKPYSGGLGSRSMADRGKPRYLGLILTGILLVFLALVALWSTLFLETGGTTTSEDPAAVAATTVAEALPDAATPSTAALPSVDEEALADLQVPVETAPPADPEPAVETVAAAAPPPETPETAPVTNLDTETSTVRQPAADPQDEIFLAAMDAPPTMPDALSLPRPADQIDPPPGPAVPPPPFGTVYQFDAAGLIIATPEGILTPEGVVVRAGRPALVPPQRPASLAPPADAVAAAPDATPTPGQTAVEAAVEAAIGSAPPPLASDPALAGFRPRARPEGLTPPTRNADDDASLAPQQDSRFASLRPLARPATVVAAAAAAAPADPAADLGAQGASLTAQANAIAAAADSNPLILAVSRKPAQRPRDMSRAVEAAVAVASRQPDPAPPPVEERAAAVEPEADGEPEVARAMPRLPTKASVSKQATFVNAINLSKVNLIGVYGTQSNRYALIRQTNGRYKKVKVGDNFDGGRIAAITASEVRYQKSGKMLTLALPKG